MSVQCSVAPLLFHLTFRTRGHKFTYIFYLTDTLLYTVYSKNAHRKLYWGMHMFMDSNKLQNYEKIRSSDQSHIWLPFITSILSPQPPPTHLPPPVTSLSWFKFRKRISDILKSFCVTITELKLQKREKKKKLVILFSPKSFHHSHQNITYLSRCWFEPFIGDCLRLPKWTTYINDDVSQAY